MKLTEEVWSALYSCAIFAESHDGSLGDSFSKEYFLAQEWLEANPPTEA